jgi:hypothetical protein
MSNTAEVHWPQLPVTGFISGRAATFQDIQDGNAVFVTKVDGAATGRPLAVTIPQYAYYTNGGKKVPVVIVQAEEDNGMQLFGFRDAAGAEYVASGPELELLGASHPD